MSSWAQELGTKIIASERRTEGYEVLKTEITNAVSELEQVLKGHSKRTITLRLGEENLLLSTERNRTANFLTNGPGLEIALSWIPTTKYYFKQSKSASHLENSAPPFPGTKPQELIAVKDLVRSTITQLMS